MKFQKILKNLQRNSSVGNDSTRWVVSTNEWPVPYYNRIFKAYPVRENKTLDLTENVQEMNDTTFLKTKDLL